LLAIEKVGDLTNAEGANAIEELLDEWVDHPVVKPLISAIATHCP
jgi:hypothetical protein